MEHYYIGSLIKSGYKLRARKLLLTVLYRVNLVYNCSSYSEILDRIYEISAPLIDVKYLKKSGQRYSLPLSIDPRRAKSVVARWVIDSAIRRPEARTFEDKLFNEVMDILMNRGLTISTKNDFHKKAISNRFFMKAYFYSPKPSSASSFNPYTRLTSKKFRGKKLY